MKKRNVLLLCAAITVAVTGCGNLNDGSESTTTVTETTAEAIAETTVKNETTSVKDAATDANTLVEIEKGICKGMKVPATYKNALEGDTKIIVGEKEMTIEEYVKDDDIYPEDEYTVGVPEFRIGAYIVCNLDSKTSKGEKSDELILELQSYDGSYAILHYEDNQVYGYEHLVYRGFQLLKKDGTYMASGGAATYALIHASFDKGNMTETVWLDRDGEQYKLNGKKCSEKKFNKLYKDFESTEDAQVEKFATPITIDGNEVQYQRINNCFDTREFSIDLNGDKKPDIIKVVSEFTEYEDMYKYKVYINDKKCKSYKANEIIGIGFLDIDTSDAIVEVAIYTQTNDDMNFGIYKYDGSKLINLNKEINDNHITVTPSGDGNLNVVLDSDNQDIGCFYYSKNYKYNNGLLVETVTDGIYDLNGYSSKQKYKLQKDLTVYGDSSCKTKAKTLKKDSQLTIDKVKYVNKPYVSDDYTYPGYYNAAEVQVKGKTVGWIKLSKKSHDWDNGMFYADTIPAWD